MNDICMENRCLVGPGYDRALERVGRELALTVHEAPSGSDVWTWHVPEAWDVREAWFAANGVRYADFARHPLHVWSHSLPFRGRVSREELLGHLTTDPQRPRAIPFDFRYYERAWGFSLEHERLAELTADHYDVVIDTLEFPGTLKVGEHVIPGRSPDSLLVVTHLDHAGQANDDLAGVAVSVEVAKRLAGRDLHHTLRFLYLPEHIGSVAYLALNEALIPTFRWGLFLEMLGVDQPLVLQHSREASSAIDRVVKLALRETGEPFGEGPFLQVIMNDEQVLDGPGVAIPTVSLSRARYEPSSLPPQSDAPPNYTSVYEAPPYPEYHSSDDSMRIISDAALEQAATVVTRAIEILDQDAYPRRRYRGTVQLSRHGLWVDWRTDPLLSAKIEYLMWCFEGDKSLSQIALETGLPFATVHDYVERFRAAGLVELHRSPLIDEDRLP